MKTLFSRLTVLTFVLLTCVIITPAAAQDAMESVLASAAPQASEQWQLCPQPSEAMRNVPMTAERLQADIDRYTLCLNRAELLMRLNEAQNTGQENAMRASNSAMTLPVGGNMPPAMPVPLTPQMTNDLLAPAGALSNDSSDSEEPQDTPPPAPRPHTIKSITGAAGQLIASLMGEDGSIETVRVGETLRNGAEVINISTTQVTVRSNDKTEQLQWGQ